MAMRYDCKHYQSRTYDSGEVARFCTLNLAPEAPWKCPDSCAGYAPSLAGVGWAHGSLASPSPQEGYLNITPAEMEVLAAAETVVEEIAPKELAKRRRNKKGLRVRFSFGRRTK